MVNPIVKPTLSHYNRPVINNPDGSYSTERNMVAGFDGVSYIIPTIVNGQELTRDQALEHFRKTGEHFGGYASDDDALNAEKAQHDITERYYDKLRQFNPQKIDAVKAMIDLLGVNK